jgi:hypothetical protein
MSSWISGVSLHGCGGYGTGSREWTEEKGERNERRRGRVVGSCWLVSKKYVSLYVDATETTRWDPHVISDKTPETDRVFQ